MLFFYFLQPSPQNIRSMLLYALKHYVDDERVRKLDIPAPESLPVMGIYHPDALSLFESFEAYRTWYGMRRPKTKGQRSKTNADALDPKSTIGLLLMRPQIVSDARKHYDGLIRAIEAEGLSVVPIISTLMDNREACEKFFVQEIDPHERRNATENARSLSGDFVDRGFQSIKETIHENTRNKITNRARVSQV